MSREEIILHNLLCFGLNFSKYAGMTNITYQSPDYILEKFNKWIAGEEQRKYWEFLPKYKEFKFKKIDFQSVLSQLNDSDIFTFMEYKRFWGQESKKIERILVYLILTQDLNLFNCVNQFERLIGSIETINNQETKGLHVSVTNNLLKTLIEKNQVAIKLITRDLKLNGIVN